MIVEAGLNTWEEIETINSWTFDPKSISIDKWILLERLKYENEEVMMNIFDKVPQDYQILVMCSPDDYCVMENNLTKFQWDIETEEDVKGQEEILWSIFEPLMGKVDKLIS